MSVPPVVVNDIAPRIQFTAAGGQTVFTYPFLIFALTDLNVFQTPAGQLGNDVAQKLTYNIQYTVTNNVQPAVGGFITLNTPANAGDIITIIRNMPESRLNNYLNGGLFNAQQVNGDFDSEVLMIQQNSMSQHNCGPYYNYSSVITPVVDNILPILPANCVWMMNSTRTQIVAALFNSGAGGGGAILPTTPDHIATFFNTTGTIKDSGFRMALVDGAANSPLVTDGAHNLSFSPFSFPITPGAPGDAIINIGGGALGSATIPGKNRLINGDFQVAQRGAGGAAIFSVPANSNGFNSFDRWQTSTGANQACTITQVAGSTAGQYYAHFQRNAGQNGVLSHVFFGQTLTNDMAIGTQGKVVTISFMAYAGANFSSVGNQLGVQITWGTGTNQSYFHPMTGATNALLGNATLTLVPQFFQLQANIPANATQVAALLQYAPTGVAGVDDGYYVSKIQFEVSPLATPYDQKSFLETLRLCQGFVATSFIYGTAPVQNAGTGTGEELFPSTNGAGPNANRSATVKLPVNMWSAGGTMTFYSPAAATGQVYDETAAAACTNTSYGNLSNIGFGITCTANAGTNPGNILGVHWFLDNELT